MNQMEYAAYLHAKHGSRQYRFARSLTGNEDAADDICQEVWCNVLKCKPENRSDVAGEFPWLCRVTSNAWKSSCRRKKVRIGEAIGDGFEGNPQPVNETPPDACLEKTEQIEAVKDCIQELSEEFRNVLEKRCEFLGNNEIGEALEILPSTVATRVHRGLAKLRACMTKKGFS